MEKEIQRIAIAQACGWTMIKGEKPAHFGAFLGLMDGKTAFIPDYLTDLNAINEAVLGRSIHHQDQFCFELWSIIRRDRSASDSEIGSVDFLVCNATPSQRAEAFLRTLHLWTTA